MKKCQPKRRYTDSDNQQPLKNSTCFYYLPKENNDINVCKSMFQRTLGYSNQKFITSSFLNVNKGFTQGDQRGKHIKPHKRSDDDTKFIKDHINKYNPCISHYRRENSPEKALFTIGIDNKRDACRLH